MALLQKIEKDRRLRPNSGRQSSLKNTGPTSLGVAPCGRSCTGEPLQPTLPLVAQSRSRRKPRCLVVSPPPAQRGTQIYRRIILYSWRGTWCSKYPAVPRLRLCGEKWPKLGHLSRDLAKIPQIHHSPPRSPLLPRLLPSPNTLHLLPVPLYLACLLYCFCFFFCKRLVSPAPDMLSYFGGRSPNRALFSSPLFCLPSDTINSYPAIRRAVGRPWEDGPTDNA